VKIEILRKKDVVFISIEGDIEISFIKEFKSQLIDIGQMENIDIEIDLSNANYIDSSGIGVLVLLYKIQTRKGKSLKLIDVSPKIVGILELCYLSDLLQY